MTATVTALSMGRRERIIPDRPAPLRVRQGFCPEPLLHHAIPLSHHIDEPTLRLAVGL